MIVTLLSCSRFFLALLFFIPDPAVRVGAILLAMLSDILDGFLARRWRQVSKLGTLLDPASDKFFVVTALVVFFQEERLNLLEIGAFLSREAALILFTFYLIVKREWSRYQIRSFIAGKVMTSLQFITLIGTAATIAMPAWFFYAMGVCGAACLIELGISHKAFSAAFSHTEEHRDSPQ